MILLHCQVCCPLSGIVRLLFSSLLRLAVLAEGSNFNSHTVPSRLTYTLQNMSEQMGNIFEMLPKAVNPLIPAQLHRPWWEGKVSSMSVPGLLLSHGHDGHTFSSRPPRTTGTTQCTLWPPDYFGQRQPVLPRTSCASTCV